MTEDTNVVPSGEGDSDEDDGDGDEDHGDGTADELAEDLEEASYTLVRDIVDAVFPDMNEKIKPVIDKARRICKFYRWDLKNQTLQSEIAREQQFAGMPKKSISLQMDCQTRWDSLCPMLTSLTNVSKPVNLFKRTTRTLLLSNEIGLLYIYDN